MAGYFRAAALDYDGTLAEGGESPGAAVLDAVADLRRAGTKVLLVTGRILADLQDDFPDVRSRFDLVVCENGAVIAGLGWNRALVAPVDGALVQALRDRGVPFRRGQVLLACDAADDVAVLEEIRRLGLDYQLVRNRGALMILPAGVSKGTGLYEALGDLRISYHSAIAVGDAENDHALLARCELGVAVANAVDALKEHADLVLDSADGNGVTALLRGPVLAGDQRFHSRRYRVRLGTRPDGEPVDIPASQLNILIAGGSRSGKSYVTGLIAEQLVALGYSVLVIDPHGDHRGLAELRGVVMLGGEDRLPEPAELARLLEHRFGSAVVDLSLLPPDDASRYLSEAPTTIERLRAATGLPHWVVVDEAHGALGQRWQLGALLESDHDGFCLASYRPQDLHALALAATDAVVILPEGDQRGLGPFLSVAAELVGLDSDEVAGTLTEAGPRQGVLLTRAAPGNVVVFELDRRRTDHVRHWHRYARSRLAGHLRFYFRRDWHTPTGSAAANLEEFHHELAHCDLAVVHHHAAHGDFSRWLRYVIRDEALADIVRTLEGRRPLEPQLEDIRQDILAAIEARYLG